jgi:altronate dehydratase
MKKGILLHESSDDVCVAAMDIKAGEEVESRDVSLLDTQPAEAPKKPDLHFMDSSSAAAEMVTLGCATGACCTCSQPGRATSSATVSSR